MLSDTRTRGGWGTKEGEEPVPRFACIHIEGVAWRCVYKKRVQIKHGDKVGSRRRRVGGECECDVKVSESQEELKAY